MNTVRSVKQAIFRDMILGTLVYAVILGFFNDYTDILRTDSYSVTFTVAIVMQVLTYLTFALKRKVAGHLKARSGRFSKVAVVLAVWLIMFLSKFVFLAVIDYLFGAAVDISGFIGLMAIILTMTLVKQLVDYIYLKLAD